jgi:hypothetical protein
MKKYCYFYKNNNLENLIMKKLMISVVPFLILLGCSSVQVTTDYSPQQDFTQYKSFKLYEGKSLPNDALTKNPLIKKRVESAVSKILTEKGFNEVDDNADFIVFPHAGVKEKIRVDTYDNGWYDPWWGPYGGYTNVSYYEEGSLVIDMVDTGKKELSWRGIGTRTIKNFSGPEEMQQVIDETVSKILDDFPPGG